MQSFKIKKDNFKLSGVFLGLVMLLIWAMPSEMALAETQTAAEALAVPPVQKSIAADVGPATVTVQKYGVVHTYSTSKRTVAQTLQSLGIAYEGRPMYPAADTPIVNGMVIHILGKYEKIETEVEPLPFTTKYIDDKKMNYGKQEIVQAGVKGEDMVTYQYVLQSGIFQKLEIARERIKDPVQAVIKRGAALSVMTRNGLIGYKKKLTVEASAYTLGEGSGSGTTSIGIIPYKGIVAVDPNFIPYYTKMYIPGYGFAMAGDTGGAVNGYVIDLFMDDYSEAIQWGRRTVDIYIL